MASTVRAHAPAIWNGMRYAAYVRTKTEQTGGTATVTAETVLTNIDPSSRLCFAVAWDCLEVTNERH
jgi:hypothetical protein